METNPQTPPRRRWLGIALTLSLALNLVIIGAIGGGLIMRDKWGHGPRAGHEAVAGGPLSRALEPDDRRKLGRELRRMRRDRGVTREARRAAVATLLDALRAVPFDAQAAAAQLAASRDGLARDAADAHALLIRHLAGMTDAQRAAFADRVEEQLAKRRRR